MFRVFTVFQQTLEMSLSGIVDLGGVLGDWMDGEAGRSTRRDGKNIFLHFLF
jgi:hypothetical protein